MDNQELLLMQHQTGLHTAGQHGAAAHLFVYLEKAVHGPSNKDDFLIIIMTVVMERLRWPTVLSYIFQ
jgi:hypothetical protein